MLFGDDKRFGKSFVPTKKDTQVLGVQAVSTEEVVGPGSYHNTSLEEQRNGWGRRSFSRRQPMTPPAKKPVFGRTDSFTAGGVVTSYGALSQPLSDKDIIDSPGPGYYSSSIFSFGATNSKHISATSQTPGVRYLKVSRVFQSFSFCIFFYRLLEAVKAVMSQLLILLQIILPNPQDYRQASALHLINQHV
jgi:hypothetical protein